MEKDQGVFAHLRQLISVVDQLRDVGLNQYINLPRIVVVGTQSAGKSSVLEGVVGYDFLPRGDGVVTRRPLELRLVHTNDDGIYAVFDADSSRTKIFSMARVRELIDEYTNAIAGNRKGIVDDPIILTISGSACPDLTLVDLPGITRVPLKGSDQTEDIERVTRDMAYRYVKDPRTIILAVIPANQDISTSDALHLARKVDPQGLRTIGVITKVDLMDQGTSALKMIEGSDVPLRLGYVAVKNRSQKDILEDRSVADAELDEIEFFKTHPAYRGLPSTSMGMKQLINKLTKVLFRHIKHFLPEIKSEITTRIRDLKSRLAELGDGIPNDHAGRSQLVWSAINDYCEVFSNTIKGKYDKRLTQYLDDEIYRSCGGSQIRGIFRDLLHDKLEANSISNLSDLEIDQAIRLHEGDSLPGFPSPDTFEYLILPYLQEINYPVLESLDRVSQTLELLLEKLSTKVFYRFPALGTEVVNIAKNALEEERANTRLIVENLVNSETGYLFTNDDAYLTSHGSMLRPRGEEQPPSDPSGKPRPAGWFTGKAGSADDVMQSVKEGASSLWHGNRKTQYSIEFLGEIKKRLISYYSVTVRNVRDTVPKTIGFFLVRKLQEHLQYILYSNLQTAAKQESLLGEPTHIREERDAITEQLEVLANAISILQKDPSILHLTMGGEFDDSYDSDLRSCLHRKEESGAQQLPFASAHSPAVTSTVSTRSELPTPQFPPYAGAPPPRVAAKKSTDTPSKPELKSRLATLF